MIIVCKTEYQHNIDGSVKITFTDYTNGKEIEKTYKSAKAAYIAAGKLAAAARKRMEE